MAGDEQEGPNPLRDDRARQMFMESDREPVVAAGTVPEGHEGVYVPTPDELQAGARQVAEAQARLATLRQELAEERLRGISLSDVGTGEEL